MWRCQWNCTLTNLLGLCWSGSLDTAPWGSDAKIRTILLLRWFSSKAISIRPIRSMQIIKRLLTLAHCFHGNSQSHRARRVPLVTSVAQHQGQCRMLWRACLQNLPTKDEGAEPMMRSHETCARNHDELIRQVGATELKKSEVVFHTATADE